MIDWAQAFYGLAAVCATLIGANFIYVKQRVDKLDEVCAQLARVTAVMEALIEKHETRLDNTDLSIHHLRESDHDIRNHLPSAFEKTEIDRRRNETHENFIRIFHRLDEMKTERYQFHREIMDLLSTKQDKPR